MLNFLQSRLLERAAKRSFFLRDTFHRGGIRVFTFLGGLEIEFLRFLINILILVVSLSAGDVATCDGVGGVDGLPSPPVVGIRVAPEVWELPPAAPEVWELPPAAPEVWELPPAAPEVWELPPAAPEVWELPPAAPEIPVLAQPLIPDLQRQDELYRRFLVNTLGENPTLRRITETVSVQSQMEGLMEAALIHLGFNPTSIVSNRHRIRGILFYPQGRALSLRQYRSHLRSIYRLGTRDTRAFQRILTAVRNSDLFL
uniref:Uncharacterized protein LOC101489699 isoform X3 n=1 Tax=Cicer arietinum TaxID=3827 RepID=A0A1S3EFW9_CICAR|nr:uncharacterized protein LOC101489699 isoform X4 [Cicer arietinum]XP_027193072.1 uncharacterized protein LOC101489699 isoform X3 [Cicer arietinum]